ncbi:hypothetical protein [Nostoc linckia]|uniref:hypothetical protein n=1 Tax=Nostoc linckia TaxID=92942 RepID=UPI0015D46D6B|nr:hypothetical protein [Nostoc linckia]
MGRWGDGEMREKILPCPPCPSCPPCPPHPYVPHSGRNFCHVIKSLLVYFSGL